jgi:cation transport regulator ChaC
MVMVILETLMIAMITGIIGVLFYIIKKTKDKLESCIDKREMDRVYKSFDKLENKLDRIDDNLLRFFEGNCPRGKSYVKSIKDLQRDIKKKEEE